MLYFAIPLKPKRFSRDWGRVGALLEATLRSVLQQTDPRFRVLLALSDVPPVDLRDPRIELVEVPPVECDPRRGFRDKRRRILEMARQVCARGGGAFAPVDADDLVSRRLAGYLNARSRAEGFEAPLGLELDHPSGRLRIAPKFWNICGTSIAVRLAPGDAPESEAEAAVHFLGRSHHLWGAALRRQGRRIRRFPFPPAVYRIHTGENLSLLARGDHGWKRAWLRRYTPSFPPPAWIRREYALDS